MNNAKDFVWWKHGVIYHIYPRSFFDSNQDGIGDIQGIIQKVSYLKSLGVDAIWLSPLYESPMYDFGYDISNYRKIDPSYGSIEDFKELLKIVHSNGIKLIMDMVMNHTSAEHSWFVESRSSKENPKRNWYIWRRGRKNKKPNNWKSAFGGSSWEYDKNTEEYYLHTFFKEQPDLNWREDELKDTMFKEVKYWLDMGVDGFRLDVINMIVKDKKFRNNPSLINLLISPSKLFSRNRPKSYKIIKQLRKLTDKYNDIALIGEIYNTPPGDHKLVASYLGNGNNGLNLAFDFSIFFKNWNARIFFETINNIYEELPKRGWPCFVFSNHDLSRCKSRYGKNSDEKALLTAVLLLTLRGTPFIYYGDEVGMSTVKVKKKEIEDPLGKKYWPIYKGRDGSRTPMQWSTENYAGFTTMKPWLPVQKDFKLYNAEVQDNNTRSLLSNYKNLISIRKRYMPLTHGSWLPIIKGENNILSYQRLYEGQRLTIILNFSSKQKRYRLTHKHYRYIYSTHPETFTEYLNTTITLLPFQAIILEVMNKIN